MQETSVQLLVLHFCFLCFSFHCSVPNMKSTILTVFKHKAHLLSLSWTYSSSQADFSFQPPSSLVITSLLSVYE